MPWFSSGRLFDRETAISRFMQKYNEQKKDKKDCKSGKSFKVITTGFDPVSAGHVCKSTVEQLKEVMDVNDLEAGQVNKGVVMWCTIIRPVYRISGVWGLVEDKSKNVFEVGLYNIVPPHLNDNEIEKRLPIGTQLGFKDPYFKLFQDGGLGLRVEHKANLEIVHVGSRVETAPTVVDPALAVGSSKAAEQLKDMGDREFRNRKFEAAAVCYTQALDGPQLPAVLRVGTLCNLSGCKLELGEYKEALADAEKALAIQADHARSLFRKAKALRGLRRYEAAMKILNSFKPHVDDKKAYAKLKGDCDDLFRKYVVGQINHNDLGRIADDFYGSIKLKFSPGKGRGLFTSKPVKTSEILIMERPFARGSMDKNKRQVRLPTMDFTKQKGFRGECEIMLEAIQSRISTSDADLARFSLLFDGSANFNFFIPRDMSFFQIDDHPDFSKCSKQLPSVTLIRSILILNSFGNDTDTQLYIVSSFMNHSSSPNTQCIVDPKSGNIVVVATTDMPAGVELTTLYGQGDLSHWGISPNL